MERTECFSGLNISALRIRLTNAVLTIAADNIPDIQLTITGDHPDTLSVCQQDASLRIAQSMNPLRHVDEVIIRIPMDWKGAIHAHTLLGGISVQGVSGTDLSLSSAAGSIQVADLSMITAHLHTVSGAIAAAGLICEDCRVRTLAGQISLNECSMLQGRISAVWNRADADLTAPFDTLSINCLWGSMILSAPIFSVDAALTSIRGQLLMDGLIAEPDAPRLRMHSITANLQLIGSLDNQATI